MVLMCRFSWQWIANDFWHTGTWMVFQRYGFWHVFSEYRDQKMISDIIGILRFIPTMSALIFFQIILIIKRKFRQIQSPVLLCPYAFCVFIVNCFFSSNIGSLISSSWSIWEFCVLIIDICVVLTFICTCKCFSNDQILDKDGFWKLELRYAAVVIVSQIFHIINNVIRFCVLDNYKKGSQSLSESLAIFEWRTCMKVETMYDGIS